MNPFVGEDEEEETAEPTPKAKRRRARILHPIDQLNELIDAIERTDDVVEKLELTRTDPAGWTVTLTLAKDENGHPREIISLDSKEALTGPLFRALRDELASVLAGRARAAEEELLRCRSAMIRTLPPSERQPVTMRPRIARRRANGEATKRRRRRSRAVDPAPEPTAPEPTDGP